MDHRTAGRDLIVVGGSSGSVELLVRLARALPPDLPAAVVVVLHSGPRSVLPALMNAHGALPAGFAIDGELLSRGRIYVAPPDRHLLFEDGRLRLTRAPKEHGFRPSVDVLFHSAALQCGPRVIGVVLSGSLDCGASGLAAIKRRGGAAIVQDPAEAAYPEMPGAAIAAAAPDFVLPFDEIAAKLAVLTREPAPA
jgi:two-component system chemotaxis response regulator CheB